MIKKLRKKNIEAGFKTIGVARKKEEE